MAAASAEGVSPSRAVAIAVSLGLVRVTLAPSISYHLTDCARSSRSRTRPSAGTRPTTSPCTPRSSSALLRSLPHSRCRQNGRCRTPLSSSTRHTSPRSLSLSFFTVSPPCIPSPGTQARLAAGYPNYTWPRSVFRATSTNTSSRSMSGTATSFASVCSCPPHPAHAPCILGLG